MTGWLKNIEKCLLDVLCVFSLLKKVTRSRPELFILYHRYSCLHVELLSDFICCLFGHFKLLNYQKNMCQRTIYSICY